MSTQKSANQIFDYECARWSAVRMILQTVDRNLLSHGDALLLTLRQVFRSADGDGVALAATLNQAINHHHHQALPESIFRVFSWSEEGHNNEVKVTLGHINIYEDADYLLRWDGLVWEVDPTNPEALTGVVMDLALSLSTEIVIGWIQFRYKLKITEKNGVFTAQPMYKK